MIFPLRSLTALGKAVIASAGAAVLLAACASSSKTIEPEQISQANFQADINTLKSRNQELRQRLEEVEGLVGRQGKGASLDDLNRRLTQLEETVNRMAATLGVDTRRAAGPAQALQPAVPEADAEYPSDPRADGPYSSTGLYGPARQSSAPGTTDPAEAIYAMGMEAYNRHDFAKANTLFAELLRGYPGARQAAAALFWQAEASYQLGDYASAALLCQDFIQKHPNDSLASSAMLKQAQSFRRLGKGQAARIVLQDVQKRYPGTPEARSAEAQLREMQ